LVLLYSLCYTYITFYHYSVQLHVYSFPTRRSSYLRVVERLPAKSTLPNLHTYQRYDKHLSRLPPVAPQKSMAEICVSSCWVFSWSSKALTPTNRSATYWLTTYLYTE